MKNHCTSFEGLPEVLIKRTAYITALGRYDALMLTLSSAGWKSCAFFFSACILTAPPKWYLCIGKCNEVSRGDQKAFVLLVLISIGNPCWLFVTQVWKNVDDICCVMILFFCCSPDIRLYFVVFLAHIYYTSDCPGRVLINRPAHDRNIKGSMDNTTLFSLYISGR